ncbi:MAG: pyrimidine 5'-nucleotidase [Deltaproteobacteria bacterium]|nr:pyrimidine 5'-nucleotidase [Deltaproteobacteria bacterium]
MKAILFDLDNTLYGADRALFNLIDVRINHYMHHVIGINKDHVDTLRQRYWQHYGVTLQGLIREHDADPEDYLNYVHDIDVPSRLSENKPLRNMLKNLPQRKFVFTNGSLCHAHRVLNCLKIDDCFEDIFDIRVSDYIPKPHRSPYDAVLTATGLTGEECVMVEDCIENLHTASALGMKTILVSDQEIHHDVDAVVRCAEEVGGVIQDWMA